MTNNGKSKNKKLRKGRVKLSEAPLPESYQSVINLSTEDELLLSEILHKKIINDPNLSLNDLYEKTSIEEMLLRAVLTGNVVTLKWLMDKLGKDKLGLLELKKQPCLKKLYMIGSNTQSMLDIAAARGHVAMVNALLLLDSPYDNETILDVLKAIYQKTLSEKQKQHYDRELDLLFNQPQMIERHLRAVDLNGRTAFHFLVLADLTQSLNSYIKKCRGGYSKTTDIIDDDHNSGLHLLAGKDNGFEILHNLEKSIEEASTPITFLTAWFRASTHPLLVLFPKTINAPNKQGKTPIMLAAEAGNPEVVNYLGKFLLLNRNHFKNKGHNFDFSADKLEQLHEFAVKAKAAKQLHIESSATLVKPKTSL